MHAYLIIPDFIKDFIFKSLNKSNHLHSIKMRNNLTEEIKKWLINNNLTASQVKYLIDNNLSEIPKCLQCNKPIKNFQLGYLFCSKKCALESEYRKNKIEKTNLERYGSKAPISNEKIKEKIKKTNLEKYGVEHFSKTDEYKEKIKETSLKKYGTNHPNESKEVQEKIKKTNLERYGVENPFQLKEVQEKIKKTNLERYGSKTFLGTVKCLEKTKNTLHEKYGANIDNAMQYIEIKRKNKLSAKRSNYQNNIQKLKEHNIEMLMTDDEYFSSEIIKYKCLLCGTIFESKGLNYQNVHCPNCYGFKQSQFENKILEWIKSIYNKEIIENDRKVISPKELDIYIPEKKIAIECNGIYWHNVSFVGQIYHQEKTLLCREKGIRLIHIFEYEWTNKQEICKSIIKSALGIYSKRIFARNCKVYPIMQNTYRDFLDENHLQGSINSSIRYGLFYQDELVAVIGFGKSRFKKGEIELHRFCSKLGYQIVGGFSKLIKHSNIQSFITYVDLAHFSGDGYKQIGFEELSITEPNYKWIDKHFNIYNRFSTQKHKLKDLLENYDDNLTEVENMDANGYLQIYDAGNLKLQYCMKNNKIDKF